MRVRDLRWHILACIILLLAYAGIAICFYLSISSGKVSESMKILGLEATKEVEELKKSLEHYKNIEATLQNRRLWAFLNEKIPDIPTHIEFIFNVIFEKEKNKLIAKFEEIINLKMDQSFEICANSLKNNKELINLFGDIILHTIEDTLSQPQASSLDWVNEIIKKKK